MALHFLKTREPFFDAVKAGHKPFQVRKDDRGFQRGDTVVLQRYGYPVGEGHRSVPGFKKDASAWRACPESEAEALTFYIGWILTGGQFGIEPGYVVFSLEDQPVSGPAM